MSESEPDLALASGRLLQLLVDASTLDEFLDDVVRLAAEVGSPAAACGLTMCQDGQPYTASSTGHLATRVDGIQYHAGEGPCLQSLERGEIVQVDDLAAERRWVRFRSPALATGVASTLSLPLAVDGRTVGALNLYAMKREAFQGSPRERAEAFTAHCAAALAVSLRQRRQLEIQEQLIEAMASRSVIDQALGILMSEQRCTAEAAFELLRQASQHRNRRLRELAADIVTAVGGAPPQSGNFHTASLPRRG
jgi:GAF domain-containing protein